MNTPGAPEQPVQPVQPDAHDEGMSLPVVLIAILATKNSPPPRLNPPANSVDSADSADSDSTAPIAATVQRTTTEDTAEILTGLRRIASITQTAALIAPLSPDQGRTPHTMIALRPVLHFDACPSCGVLYLDPTGRFDHWVNLTPVPLSRRLASILRFFIASPGVPLSAREIADWCISNHLLSPDLKRPEHQIEKDIGVLRQHLDDVPTPTLITTERNAGYVFRTHHDHSNPSPVDP